jgi:hypothetical protein
VGSVLFIPPELVSGDSIMFWRIEDEQQRQQLKLPVPESGRFEVLARFVTGPNFGKVRFEFDGRELKTVVDTYSSTSIHDYEGAAPVSLGVIESTAGDHVFSWISAGKNPDSSGFWIGMDYLRLVRLP